MTCKAGGVHTLSSAQSAALQPLKLIRLLQHRPAPHCPRGNEHPWTYWSLWKCGNFSGADMGDFFIPLLQPLPCFSPVRPQPLPQCEFTHFPPWGDQCPFSGLPLSVFLPSCLQDAYPESPCQRVLSKPQHFLITLDCLKPSTTNLF